MDWHQTGTNVVISIYAKKYLPASSKIKLGPVRLTVEIYFPEVDSKYNLDIELFKVRTIFVFHFYQFFSISYFVYLIFINVF